MAAFATKSYDTDTAVLVPATWTRLVITHLVVHDVEGVGPGPGLGLHVDAVVLVDGALAEDDAVEGSVEADLHLHVGLPAHHLHSIWRVTNKNI